MDLTETLPLAGRSFAQIRGRNMLYIDKTDLVARLAGSEGPFFLARPPGFGKSLLLSTFKELFENGKKNFEGLKLEKDAPWIDKGSYKVLHLNLARISSAGSKITFEERLSGLLASEFGKYDVAWGNDKDWLTNFSAALGQCSPRSLVLLIDEGDAPISCSLKDPDEFEDRREIITDLLITTKEFSDKFRFVFIAAVAGPADICGDLQPGNVRDISFHNLYGAIAGIAQGELETCCRPYIANAAQVLNAKDPGQGWDEAKVLDELKIRHGGWCFEREGKIRVCNPRSVLGFLAAPEKGFTPGRVADSPLLSNALGRLIKADNARERLCRYLASDYETTLSERQLSAALNIKKVADNDAAFNAILYRTGILAIKDSDTRAFTLGFPNQEVKAAFANLVEQKLNCLPGREDLLNEPSRSWI